MREESVPGDMRPLVYSFFYWFSQFEFAVKEAPILRTTKVGDAAMPGSIGSFCQDQTFAVADLNDRLWSLSLMSRCLPKKEGRLE